MAARVFSIFVLLYPFNAAATGECIHSLRRLQQGATWFDTKIIFLSPWPCHTHTKIGNKKDALWGEEKYILSLIGRVCRARVTHPHYFVSRVISTWRERIFYVIISSRRVRKMVWNAIRSARRPPHLVYSAASRSCKHVHLLMFCCNKTPFFSAQQERSQVVKFLAELICDRDSWCG